MKPIKLKKLGPKPKKEALPKPKKIKVSPVGPTLDLIENNYIQEILNNLKVCEQIIAEYQNMLNKPIMTLAQVEKEYIIKTLSLLNGNKMKTAKLLDITNKTLYNKLHLYGLI